MKKRNRRDLTNGNPFTTILIFAVPMILSNLFQQFYNIVDSILVGNILGADALAAVGSVSTVTAVLVQLASGFSMGGSIVIAQYAGAGKNREVRLCISTLAIFSVIAGGVFMVLLYLGMRPVISWIRTPQGLVADSSNYLKFYLCGSIPLFLYNALNGAYVAVGDSQTPLLFLVVASVINVALDYFFLAVLHTGVSGAALATAISQAVAAVLALFWIPRLLTGAERTKWFDKKMLGQILIFALPNALQQSVVSVGTVVVQATINGFGTSVMAGSAAAAKIVNLITALPMNYSNAFSTYVGQNIGARRPERIGEGLKASLLLCGSLSIMITIGCEAFAEKLTRIFIQEEDPVQLQEMIQTGAAYIRVVAGVLVVFTVFMMLKAVLKGAGDMKWFLATTLLSFFIRLILTTGLAPFLGTAVIWWSIAAGWVIACGVALLRYHHGGWMKKRIEFRDKND